VVAYSFQPRFVAPILDGRKTHTLRAGRRRHAAIGETMQLYTGMRTTSCRKIGEAICDRIYAVQLMFDHRTPIVFYHPLPIARGAYLRDHERPVVDKPDPDAFARSDGFTDFADMREFWFQTHDLRHGAEWHGFLIGWKDFSCA
jgi:hypothetical protein